MTLREAAQQALDALEQSRVFVTTREKTKHPEGTEWYDERITALRTALAEDAMQRLTDVHQEMEATINKMETVEPVAWMVYTLDGQSAFVTDNPADFTSEHRVLPLYTAPLKVETEENPVAWMYQDLMGYWVTCYGKAKPITARPTIPLYKAQPKRKPLTQESLENLFLGNDSNDWWRLELKEFVNVARALERAHDIGGEK